MMNMTSSLLAAAGGLVASDHVIHCDGGWMQVMCDSGIMVHMRPSEICSDDTGYFEVPVEIAVLFDGVCQGAEEADAELTWNLIPYDSEAANDEPFNIRLDCERDIRLSLEERDDYWIYSMIQHSMQGPSFATVYTIPRYGRDIGAFAFRKDSRYSVDLNIHGVTH